MILYEKLQSTKILPTPNPVPAQTLSNQQKGANGRPTEVSKLERTRCGRFWLTFAVGFVLVVCLVSLMACRALTPLARRGWRPISTREKWRVWKVRIENSKNIWRKFENPRSRQSEVSENVLPSWRMLIDQFSIWRNVLLSKTDSFAEVFSLLC